MLQKIIDKIQIVVALLSFTAMLLILQGCVGGVRSLGSVDLQGAMIEYIQVGSKGQDGPKLIVIEGFVLSEDGTINKVSAYSASGNSLTGQILGGTGAAAMAAGGNVGAAYLRKPNTTRVSTSVSQGDSSATSSQSQGQSQSQEQSQEASGGSGGDGGNGGQGGNGCPGNSCGQGGNGQND